MIQYPKRFVVFVVAAASIPALPFGRGVAVAQEAGPPRHVDLFATDQAFLRRTIRPRFEVIGDAAGDQYRESVLFAWTIGRRVGIEGEASLVQFDSEFGGSSSAFGGIELTPKLTILRDVERQVEVAAGSGFAIPVGDQDEWLATHGWRWKPRLLFWKGWGSRGRNALQFELGYDVPYDDPSTDDPAMVFNAGYSHWTDSNWIPILEVTALRRLGHEVSEGATPLDRAALHGGSALRGASAVFRDTETLGESDRRAYAGTLGFRYAFSDGQQWGAGFRFPIFGVAGFEWGLIVAGTIRLP